MLKKLLSMSLAIMMMSSGILGCHNDSAPADASEDENPEKPADTEAPVHDEESFVNESGEAMPITLLATGKLPDNEPVYSPAFTEANSAFASVMLNALEEGESAVFSPLSLQIAFEVLSNGADEATAKKLLDVICPGLSIDEVNESSKKLISLIEEDEGVNVESAVVFNKELRICSRFANIAADSYLASVGALDFSDPASALAEINGWIEQNTDGLIRQLIDELGPDTAVVILNALTLKLDWEKPFTAIPSPETFNGLRGEETASMIQSTGKYAFGVFDEGSMAIIPYAGGKYAMAVMLPGEGCTPVETASALIGRYDECEVSGVFVKMPKLKLETKLDIMGMADKLGLSEAIDGFYPGLADDESVIISKILHGASLEVTEFGTTAAAATAIVSLRGAAFLPEIKELICDRPYALVIFNIETGAALFVSVINDV